MVPAVNAARVSQRGILCATPVLHRIKQSVRNKIKKREMNYVPFVL
jgi:hypothetical protein